MQYARLADLAQRDGVNMDPSDADRPTTWWVAQRGRAGECMGICGMMPVEDGGQRLRGSWVAPEFRRRGVWWTMVEFRITQAYERGAEWVETYAVHAGPLLRRGWQVKSSKHRDGAVHVGRRLVEAPAGGEFGTGHAELRVEVPTGRRFWYVVEDGWMEGAALEGPLVLAPEHFGPGTLISMDEPVRLHERLSPPPPGMFRVGPGDARVWEVVPSGEKYCGTCTRCKVRPGSPRETPSTATGTVSVGCVCDTCWAEIGP